jgi:protein-S-isoprenylcysteine O-methyltransferase Ste14
VSGVDSTAPDDEPDREAPVESIVVPSPLLFLIAFLCGIVLDRHRPARVVSNGRTRLLGTVVFVAGTGVFVGAIRTLRDVGATPAHDDDPPTLVTGGVFAYSRNPIYLGNCLQYLGLSILYGSPWHLFLLVPLVGYLRRVIDREEAALEATFSREFEEYREEVRRWL